MPDLGNVRRARSQILFRYDPHLLNDISVHGGKGGAVHLISVLGLITLLALAWVISVDRRDVRPRSILWGIGLQFLFALIILREDVWSFVGMGILALLIVAYLMRGQESRNIGWGPTLATVVAMCSTAGGA